MLSNRTSLIFVLLGLGLAACTGKTEPPRGDRDGGPGRDGGGPPVPFPSVCLIDPDSNEVPDQCPEFFSCQTLAARYAAEGTNKRCVNPGPETPPDLDNDGHLTEYRCIDRDGTTTCYARGALPDGASDGGFNCVQSGEFVVCTSDAEYPQPSEGDSSLFYCYFAEMNGRINRVCDTGFGDENGWICFATGATPGSGAGYRCRNNSPGVPSEIPQYVCDDVTRDGTRLTECTAAGPVPPDANPSWECIETRSPDGTVVSHVCSNEPETPGFPPGGPGLEAPPGSTPPGQPPGSPPQTSVNGDNPQAPPPGQWVCEYEFGSDAARVCDFVDTSRPGTTPPGDDDDDDDMTPPPTTPPEYPPGSACPFQGLQAWCDDAVYCSWGKQICQATPGGGFAWSRCMEPSYAGERLTDRPDSALGCRYYYFNEDGCEDQQDRNGDSRADCYFVPPGTTPPAGYSGIPVHASAPNCDQYDRSAGRMPGDLCSFCEIGEDCASGVCASSFEPGHVGYALCSTEGRAGCPTGYTQVTVGSGPASQQICLPSDGSCE